MLEKLLLLDFATEFKKNQDTDDRLIIHIEDNETKIK